MPPNATINSELVTFILTPFNTLIYTRKKSRTNAYTISINYVTNQIISGIGIIDNILL
ncbi:hypothetical protein GCM10011607_17030 [Shewanella inventionis]|uniref:Uncharacterized protein n=1 Tax=Shewanella inventionis TaxID=1738770 RepID=A0ABQ1J2G1_9GAMM|nr:hypothetical protein GCM10011607_17030 [Shewanella inventionis]